MQNKRKLTKTAVAVMAVGGVAVVASPGVEASSPFSDVPESSYYYQDILELHKRGVINGVGNGKFMPEASVTRGQAAKMLAATLKLDVKNIKNPNFKDVSTNNIYYPYIAALAEKGVINGFGDGTFRPDEVITRGQMATIVVKGFEFTQATTLNHSFKDVDSRSFYAPFVQTLVNLNVTKGTTAVTFSPADKVTRGQMATFLMRAEKVEVTKDETKLITSVQSVNNNFYVYVNGIKHTVDPKLNNILNATNGEALKGAQIEGKISGTTIQTIEKITFKAVGASNKLLKFDGKGSTFNGSVDITGDNLHFSNWNVTGTISIKEPGRKSLAEYVNPAVKSLNTVASVSDGFIDWNKLTPSGNVSQNGLTTPNSNPKLPALNNATHNIKFENVTMKGLVIDSDKASISSNKKFSNVRVTGYVREFEIFANITDLYIESNEHVVFYGSSNVGTLYKNSYMNVSLQAESATDLIIVDNKSGWLDLGDFYYVNKVIIPKDHQVHDIFGDFLNDENKIKEIEDSAGKEVDKDLIENIIIPDVTPPTLSIKNVTTNLATTNIVLHSNEDARIYYVIKTQKEQEPTMREILHYSGSKGGKRDILEDEEILIHIPYLEDKQQYVVYAIAVDNAGNVSRIQNKKFEIIDATPPVIKSASIKGLPGGKRLEVSITPDEPGEYFYYYEPLLSSGSANNYTSKEIFDFEKMNYRNQTGKGKVDEAGKMQFVIPGLEPLTKYAVYVVMKDKYGNEIRSPKVLTATTGEKDEVNPYITDGELYPVNSDSYEFEINLNEAVDPVAANDINNYELSGTAILNITGQPTTIKPDSVHYVEGSKKIRIRVPSATALVNGDTIIVKVLKNVKDLAGNEFINIDVVETVEEVKNTASYIFSDSLEPELTIEKFQLNAMKTSGILTYKANKAGTYYYMVVPNSYDMNGVSKRDFYNEFTSYPTLSNDKRIPFLVKQGENGNNNVVVGTQTNNVILQNADNPFESYSLYMVIKDRSGNLSEIKKVENVINDTRAPFVQAFSAKAKEGSDTIAEITLQASEAGTLFYTRLEKQILDRNTGRMIDNPEIEEIRNWHTVLNNKKENHSLINSESAERYVNKIRTWKNTELQKDILTKFEDVNLKAHTEYVYFFAVQDAFGNVTMYAENTETADKTDYASNQMETTVYTDGIAPTLDPIIKLIRKPELERISIKRTYDNANGIGDGVISHVPGKTFIMTFSEAIKYTGQLAPGQSELEKLASTIENSMGVTIEDMEWEETSSTADKRKLVFTVQSVPTRDVAVNTVSLIGFTDLGKPNGKSFAETTAARYLEPGVDLNTIAYAQLIGDVKGPLVNHLGEERYESQSVILGMELNVRNDVQQKYYFITQTKDSSELNSFEDVVNVAENPFYGGYRGIGVVGSGDVSRNITSGGANEYSRSLTVNSGSGVFMSSQKLYLVTMDEYGNIVGVQGGVKFVPIIK